MSKKLLTTLTAILILFSTIAIAIQPASAAGAKKAIYYPSLKVAADGVAEWERTVQHTSGGAYSVSLKTFDLDDEAGVRLTFTDITLDDIESFSFWYFEESAMDYPGPRIRFLLDANNDDDWDPVEGEDLLIASADFSSSSGKCVEGEWFEVKPLTQDDRWWAVDPETRINVYGEVGASGYTFDLLKAEDNPRTIETDTLGECKVLAAEFYLGKVGTDDPTVPKPGPGTGYLDDIRINAITVDFEPAITIEYEWYMTVDSVKVTVFDIGLNVRPVKDTGYFIASSDYPDQITVPITETGFDTSIFEGTFSLETDPELAGPNDLLVKDGSGITVSYDRDKAISVIEDDATVDGAKPVSWFTVPAENNTAHAGETYTISGKASGNGGSDIYVVEVSTDNQLTWKKATGTTEWNYDWTLPEDGNYTAWCRATDVAGNVETPKNPRFIIVDNTGPDVTEPKATPPKAIAGGTTVLTAKVTEQWTVTSVASVTINLTSIDGSETQQMFDDGTQGGDVDSGDGIYTYTATVAELVADGVYYLNITATDNLENVNATEAIVFEVVTDEVPPVIESWSVEYPLGKETGRVGDNINITVIVTDLPAGVNTVEINGTEITGVTEFVLMERIGTTDAWNIILTVVEGVDDGIKYLNVTATDYAANTASVLVEVEILEAQRAFEIGLVKGLNLISLPLIPNNSTIEAVLGDVVADIDVVWAYDAATETWFMYSPAAPEVSDLTQMADGKGYWIKATSETTIIVYGVEFPPPPTPFPQYKVVPGWNLIGFKELVEMAAEDYLAGVEYVRLWSFVEGRWVLVGPDDSMIPGLGYWIAVTEEGWIYP